MILVRQAPYDAHRQALAPTSYSDRMRMLAKELPGVAWDGEKRVWHGYADSINLLADRLVKEKVARVTRADRPPSCSIVSFSESPLRPYQKEGAAFIVKHGPEGCILADATGLGKSVTALHAAKELEGPALIVCPANVRSVWAGVPKTRRTSGRPGEIEKWLGVKPTVLSGTKPYAFDSTPFVVIHYEILWAWIDMLTFPTVVFDEGQTLVSNLIVRKRGEEASTSRRSRAAQTIAKRAKNRIVLTATPIQNRPRDLWNVIETISPGRFGKKPFPFYIRYCDAKKETIETRDGERQVWNTKGASNLEELNARLKQFMLRRTKQDVRLEIPPMTRQIIEVDVPRNAITDDWSIDKKMLRWALGLSAKGKTSSIAESVQEKLAEDSKVVVFVYHHDAAHDMQEALRLKGIDSFLATGEQTVQQRQKAVESAREGQGVLIASMTAMGTGIDLSFADVVMFLELSYIPADLIQAEGRLHRFGQLKNVLVIYWIGTGTIDELVRDAVLAKLETFEKTIGELGDSFKTDLAPKRESEEDALAALRDALRAMEAA